MPLKTFTTLGLGKLTPTKLLIELVDKTVKQPIAENVLVKIEKFVFPVDFVILDMPEDVKIPLILGRPFLSTVHAKIDVFKRKISLKVGNHKLVYKCQNPSRSIIRNIYALGFRELMDLDLEAKLMGETLILNNSTNPNHENFEEFIDLNVPAELRRDIIDDSDDE